MKKITVIGSTNMDLTIQSPKLPTLGETILGGGFLTVPGGKGANQAVAIAKLGYEVSLIGCIGEDAFGRQLAHNLEQSGVTTDHLMAVPDAPTGVAVIVVQNGNNFIIVDPGANDRLLPDTIEKLEDVIAASEMIVLQMEIPIETIRTAVEIAHCRHVRVLLNPAPAAPLERALLSQIDLLTPNETECAILTGRQVTDLESAKAAAASLLDSGARTIAVTLGKEGVLYNRPGSGELIYRPAHTVNAVDTTAAGDSFTGALAVAISAGKDMDTAIEYATAVAALTVTRRGAQESLPTAGEVEAHYQLRF